MCKTTLIASAASLFNCINESILHTLAKCIYAKSNLEWDQNGRPSSEDDPSDSELVIISDK